MALLRRLAERRPAIDAPVLAIFVAALILRLLFVTTVLQIPVWGDIPAYAGIALGMGHFFLYGDVYPLTARLYFSRGPFLPSLYMLAFAAYFRNDFTILKSMESVLNTFNWDIFRYAQAGVDSATCVGVALIGRRLFGRRAGTIGGVFAALYPPFILWVGQPLREVWVAFGLLASTLLTFVATERGNWRWYAGAGLALAITGQMLPGPIGLGLAGPWLAGWVYWRWREHRSPWAALMEAWPAYVGFLGVWALRWGLMYLVVGRIAQEVVGVGATGGFWHHLDTSGWPPDGFVVPGASVSVRQGSESILGIVLGGVGAFWASPGDWLWVLAQNFYRLWAYPYNIFSQTFLLDWNGQVVIHWVLVALALVFAPISIARAPRSSLLALFPLYLTAFFGAESVETRFVAMGFPLLMPIVGYGLHLIEHAIRPSDARSRFRLTLLLGGVVFVQIVRLPQLLAIWPALSPLAAQIMWIALGLVLGGVGLQWLAVRISNLTGPGTMRWGLRLGAPLLLAASLYTVFGSSRWHTWSATLSGPWAGIHPPPEQIEQVIELPADGLAEGPVVLLADLETNDSNATVISVNGQVVKPAGRPLDIRSGKFASFYEVWSQFTGHDLSDIRQWWEIPIPAGLLKGARTAIIQVWVAEGNPYSWVRVYGDYLTGGTQTVFDGPRMPFAPEDMSLYRFRWDLSREPRLDGRTPLFSRSTTSRRYAQSTWQSADLSAAPGRQTGVFRLRLAVRQSPKGETASADGRFNVIVY